ncbi:MAG TPA: hypothetical protein VHL53_13770 [Acidimicrobiia bacterium]|nr:hypothetical protein [Acidimicrobiia bacterium]
MTATTAGDTPGPPAGPARNRVMPTGDIVAIPRRGAWCGNRGVLHRGREIVRFHGGDRWITCTLDFNGRWQEQWRPGHYTMLYFADEAVALAAGHRPCGECRRPAYLAYRAAWAAGLGGPEPSARAMDRRLHGERLVAGTSRRRFHPMPWASLPDGVFVLLDGTPAVVLGDGVTRWTVAGWAGRHARPRSGEAKIITPPATVAVLRAGYRPQIDAEA